MQANQIHTSMPVYVVPGSGASSDLLGVRGEVHSIDRQLGGKWIVSVLFETKNWSKIVTFRPEQLESAESLTGLIEQAQTLKKLLEESEEKVSLLEAQVRGRSRQLEMARGLADEHAETIKRKDSRILQANNQILRHETSIKDLRAKLRRVQDNHDLHQQRSMEKSHEIESLNDQAKKRDQILDGWDKRAEHDTSIITSLRSQIESLQSINESQKLIIDGHAPAIQKLQVDLTHALQKRCQFEKNTAYWRGIAEKLGYNPGITEDKLDPSPGARLDLIERFLSEQFEGYSSFK